MMSAADPARVLSEGCCCLLGRDLSETEQQRLLAYLDLLQRWNSAYNLTAIRDPLDMVTRHILDSVAILPWIDNGAVLDAGTGAGLPGVPLALFRPEAQFTLLDSAGKKIRFLRQVKRELGLENISPVQARLEAHQPEFPYQAIVSRAFASLADFAEHARHLLSANTRLLAMKGKNPEAEYGQLPSWVQVVSVEELSVPGLQEQRHLVIMSLTQ